MGFRIKYTEYKNSRIATSIGFLFQTIAGISFLFGLALIIDGKQPLLGVLLGVLSFVYIFKLHPRLINFIINKDIQMRFKHDKEFCLEMYLVNPIYLDAIMLYHPNFLEEHKSTISKQWFCNSCHSWNSTDTGICVSCKKSRGVVT